VWDREHVGVFIHRRVKKEKAGGMEPRAGKFKLSLSSTLAALKVKPGIVRYPVWRTWRGDDLCKTHVMGTSLAAAPARRKMSGKRTPMQKPEKIG
jgi:hypothetical protein